MIERPSRRAPPLLLLLLLTATSSWLSFARYDADERLVTHTFAAPTRANEVPGSADAPRISRDQIYSAAVLGAWANDTDIAAARVRGAQLLSKRHTYQSDGVTLFGEYLWEAGGASELDAKKPGALLFHTGAGPRDVFLQWRGSALAAMGFVVFIADMIGDPAGDRWDATSWLSANHVPPDPASAAVAAIEQLRAHPLVDGTRVVAMGWCAGGVPIFELLRARITGLVAVVGFHAALHACTPTRLPPSTTSVLLCVGDADPIAGRPAEVYACTDRLRDARMPYEVHTYGPNVRHAFTNPGQVHAPEGTVFQYDADAAAASWRAARELLCATTGVPVDGCA